MKTVYVLHRENTYLATFSNFLALWNTLDQFQYELKLMAFPAYSTSRMVMKKNGSMSFRRSDQEPLLKASAIKVNRHALTSDKLLEIV